MPKVSKHVCERTVSTHQRCLVAPLHLPAPAEVPALLISAERLRRVPGDTRWVEVWGQHNARASHLQHQTATISIAHVHSATGFDRTSDQVALQAAGHFGPAHVQHHNSCAVQQLRCKTCMACYLVLTCESVVKNWLGSDRLYFFTTSLSVIKPSPQVMDS